MKNKISLCILVCCSLFFANNAFAQNTNEEDELLIENQGDFILLNQLENTPTEEKKRNIVERSNMVFIQQIGTGNKIFSDITAKSSDIQLNQNGENNLIEIDETSKEIQKFITQNGNNNVVNDFSINPDMSTSLEILQEGNNLYFEKFGSNELSKSLKFKMSGEAKTIIVRSF